MNAVLTSPIRRHRLSVEDYHRMGKSGVLGPEARVELIEGEIIDMSPIGSRHAAVVARLNRHLQRAVGDRALVLVQSSIRLSNHSEPEPDLALLRPRTDDYAAALPTATDALLIIEVADSSAAYDLQVKMPLYARHGVPELWVLDLDAGTVHRFRQPKGEQYLEIQAGPRPGRVAVAALPDVSVDFDAVLAGVLTAD